jgi:hypothetical protein
MEAELNLAAALPPCIPECFGCEAEHAPSVGAIHDSGPKIFPRDL